MNDLETFVWIIFGVIYIISRILKGRSKQKKMQRPGTAGRPAQRPATSRPVRQSAPTPQPQATERKPGKKSFFDEILKEIEKNLAGDEEREPGPPQREAPERRKEKTIPFEWEEEVEVETEPKVSTQEPSKYQKYGGMDYMEERAKFEEDMIKFGKSDIGEEIETTYSFYGELLRNPDELKKAIIMSEILNRKYL